MRVLLKEGTVIEERDVFFCFGGFEAVHPDWVGKKTHAKSNFIFRDVAGWAAVIHAIKTEVLGNDVEGCETTDMFWDCECQTHELDPEMKWDHIHPESRGFCCHCDVSHEEAADSRIAEVLLKLIGERN